MSWSASEFLVHAELDQATLEIWVAEGWLVPVLGQDRAYGEADLARARLIRDLINDLGVNAEGVGVILHLVDQLHGLRSALSDYVKARLADAEHS